MPRVRTKILVFIFLTQYLKPTMYPCFDISRIASKSNTELLLSKLYNKDISYDRLNRNLSMIIILNIKIIHFSVVEVL